MIHEEVQKVRGIETLLFIIFYSFYCAPKNSSKSTVPQILSLKFRPFEFLITQSENFEAIICLLRADCAYCTPCHAGLLSIQRPLIETDAGPKRLGCCSTTLHISQPKSQLKYNNIPNSTEIQREF